ncbi:MAG: right-handed parallel beta-helix repeat-containing protein [Polyangiaceae bacterium]|nr:right-handed parallel beta-helix repeat-containing protein [Polyangiaceae bacterium]
MLVPAVTAIALGLPMLVGCAKDEGAELSHEGETEGFDFPYDSAPPAMSDVTGTPIGATPIATAEIGAWVRELPAFDQTLYVRPPGQTYGAGDGSSWTDAISGFPAELARGTEYLFAAGDYYDGPYGDDRYFQHEFVEAEAGSAYIGLFKATAESHGSDTGWQEVLGQGPSRLGPLALVTGYLVIDGQVGLGGVGDDYGFELSSRDCDHRRDSPVTFPWNSTASHVLLRHVNIQDCGHRLDPTNGSEDAIYTYDNGLAQFVLENSYVHDAFRCVMFLQNCADVRIEGVTLARGGLHHEANTIALRNCEDVAIQRNVLVDAYGSMISLQGVRRVMVHGNVLRRTLDNWELWAAIHLTGEIAGVSVHGNTFHDLAGLNVGVRADGNVGSALQVFNNLWAHSRTNQVMLSGEHAQNAFYDNLRDGTLLDDAIEEETNQVLDAEPFVDAAAGDVRLSGPTAAGQALEAPFDVDLAGVARGGDGVWDRGAYEYAE